MKIGLGLYCHMLSPDYFSFARQAGCTDVVIHLTDYFRGAEVDARNNQPIGGKYKAWGFAGDPDALWTVSRLRTLKQRLEEAGLRFAAIENLDPAFWYDVLLDGPKRPQQIKNVQAILRSMGEVGIPILGYNFSLAGVCGRVMKPSGRGGALSVGMDGAADEEPIPNGMVWNMIYDRRAAPGVLPPTTHGQLWDRLERFLREIIPVAEEAGVQLAAHPDDPPMPTMRQQPRLVYQPGMYQRLLDLVPSPKNALELCVGTIAEMTEGDIYNAVDEYSRQGKIAYIHLRNVSGKVPHYSETFIDEGDVDMIRILDILDRNGFDGILVPDHTPAMSCPAPWHAGMAHTLGFIAAALAVQKKRSTVSGQLVPVVRQ